MAVRRRQEEHEGSDEALIGVFLEENGLEVVRYFTSVAEAERAIPASAIEEGLQLAGAWEDLDIEQMLDELDRIRHESRPTPPFSL